MEASSSNNSPLGSCPFRERRRQADARDPNIGAAGAGDGHLDQRRSRPKTYVCEVCTRPFDRPSLLAQHALVHTGEKPYLCPRCDTKRFARTSNLYRHMRTCPGKPSTNEQLSPSSSSSGSPTPRPATPTSQAHLIEERSPPHLDFAPLPGETSHIFPDPSWGPTAIKSWRPQRSLAARSTDLSLTLRLPVARRFYVPLADARFYLSVISIAAAGGSTTVPSSPRPGSSQWSTFSPDSFAPRNLTYADAVGVRVTGWESLSPSASSSHVPTTSRGPQRIAFRPELSWPISQRVYVPDATFYKSIISAALEYGGHLQTSQSGMSVSPYSTLSPGIVPQNSTYATNVGEDEQPEGLDTMDWGYPPGPVASSASGSQFPFPYFPTDFTDPSDAEFVESGPGVTLAESNIFWGNFLPQADAEPDIAVGSAYDWPDDSMSM